MKARHAHTAAAALVLACLAAPAAAEDWLTVSGFSYHFQPDRRDWRQVNPGIGFERSTTREDLYLAGGYFKNSYDRHAFYGGVRWTPWAIGPVRLGAYALATTGYQSPIVVLPAFTADWRGIGVNGTVLPNLPGFSGFVGLQFKFRLN